MEKISEIVRAVIQDTNLAVKIEFGTGSTRDTSFQETVVLEYLGSEEDRYRFRMMDQAKQLVNAIYSSIVGDHLDIEDDYLNLAPGKISDPIQVISDPATVIHKSLRFGITVTAHISKFHMYITATVID